MFQNHQGRVYNPISHFVKSRESYYETKQVSLSQTLWPPTYSTPLQLLISDYIIGGGEDEARRSNCNVTFLVNPTGSFSSVYLARLKHYPEVNELFALKHIIPTTHPSRIENELKCLLNIGWVLVSYQFPLGLLYVDLTCGTYICLHNPNFLYYFNQSSGKETSAVKNSV